MEKVSLLIIVVFLIAIMVFMVITIHCRTHKVEIANVDLADTNDNLMSALTEMSVEYDSLVRDYISLKQELDNHDIPAYDEFEATAYNCNDPSQGTNNITAIGVDLERRWTSYFQFIAVDPDIIPLGSIVEIKGMGYFLAVDTGGAIKGKRIDILYDCKDKAMEFGRQPVEIRVLQ